MNRTSNDRCFKKGNPKVKQHEWFVNGATHSGKGQSVSSFRNLNISHSGTPKSSTLDRRFHYKSFISGDVPFLGNLHIFDVAGIQMLQGYSDIAMVDLGKPSRSSPCRTQESRRPRSQRPGKNPGDFGSEDREIDLHDVAILIWNMENK